MSTPHPAGIELIAVERQRQIEQEGWTPEHDDNHQAGELAQAACYYAYPFHHKNQGFKGGLSGIEAITVHLDMLAMLWPKGWNAHWRKRREDLRPRTHRETIRDLAKAGALIAAEIDRIQRQEGGAA